MNVHEVLNMIVLTQQKVLISILIIIIIMIIIDTIHSGMLILIKLYV